MWFQNLYKSVAELLHCHGVELVSQMEKNKCDTAHTTPGAFEGSGGGGGP